MADGVGFKATVIYSKFLREVAYQKLVKNKIKLVDVLQIIQKECCPLLLIRGWFLE